MENERIYKEAFGETDCAGQPVGIAEHGSRHGSICISGWWDGRRSCDTGKYAKIQ